VHNGIIAIDKQGYITVFNRASEKITGFSRQEAMGRPITEIIPQTRLLGALEREQSVIGDIQTLDSQTVVATNRIPVVVDGEVRGAVGTYQDITEVQRLEQKIRIKLAEKGFVAQYDTSMLIFGSSGVGKELFAQSIHRNGKRKNAPFVAINCAALPESLIESELFGYAEGSFTGAVHKGKAGLFEMAHGGTIFLDGIGELPLLLQGRLLRVLQEKQVMRLGDNKLIPVDMRIICATNLDLRLLVDTHQFRGDLYFRIAIRSRTWKRRTSAIFSEERAVRSRSRAPSWGSGARLCGERSVKTSGWVPRQRSRNATESLSYLEDRKSVV
jgi:PAS domain S-box-containing protein